MRWLPCAASSARRRFGRLGHKAGRWAWRKPWPRRNRCSPPRAWQGRRERIAAVVTPPRNVPYNTRDYEGLVRSRGDSAAVAVVARPRLDAHHSRPQEPPVPRVSLGRPDRPPSGARRLVVTSQATRTQARNLEDARDKVRGLVHAALERPRRRRPTAPSRGAEERRIAEKKHHGKIKRLRTRAADE